MTIKLPNGQVVEINADESDVQFIQALIVLNDKITNDVSRMAMDLVTEADTQTKVQALIHLKTHVGELHEILSSIEAVEGVSM